MYVRRVQLTDVRGFRNLDFKFEQPSGKCAGWVVVTGDNGSGKSALLRAIALCLTGPDVARSLQPSLEGWVRHGASRATVAVEVKRCEQFDSYKDPGRTTDRFWTELEVTVDGSGDRGSAPVLKELARRKPVLAKRRGPWAPNPSGWFSAGYGPFRRLYGSSERAARVASLHGPPGRFVTLFEEAATLEEAELWLKELDHRRQRDDPKAKRTLAVVEGLLNADFLYRGLSVDRIDPDGVWLRDAAGVVLAMRDMSDGYRAAVALVADILRHMVDVYGHDALTGGDEGALSVWHPGVVLIDEVDVHLHPEWQRNIGEWLKQHFPAVQFIVATHSPLIAQAADDRMLFQLPGLGSDGEPRQATEDKYNEVRRGRPDEILRAWWGMKHTRSDRAEDARTQYSRLRSKQRRARLTKEEEEALQAVLPFVDPLPVDDEE